jgi:hypothetical protein
MTRRRDLLACALLLGSTQACAGRPAAPDPLGLADLRVADLAVDAESAAVRARLGAPVTTSATSWTYRDLVLTFEAGRVAGLTLTGPAWRTTRGLRVGDSRARALGLYAPCYADSTLVQVCYMRNDFDERAVIIALADDRVTRITVGRLLEP